MPKFAILLHSNRQTEASEMPSSKLLGEMMEYNESLVKAGVMVAGEGLRPTSDGARVVFSKSSGFDTQKGPFTSVPENERICGFYIFKTDSQDDAISWLKKMPGWEDGAIVEVRRVFDGEDFGDAFTPEMRKKEDEMRETISKKCGN